MDGFVVLAPLIGQILRRKNREWLLRPHARHATSPFPYQDQSVYMRVFGTKAARPGEKMAKRCRAQKTNHSLKVLHRPKLPRRRTPHYEKCWTCHVSKIISHIPSWRGHGCQGNRASGDPTDSVCLEWNRVRGWQLDTREKHAFVQPYTTSHRCVHRCVHKYLEPRKKMLLKQI